MPRKANFSGTRTKHSSKKPKLTEEATEEEGGDTFAPSKLSFEQTDDWEEVQQEVAAVVEALVVSVRATVLQENRNYLAGLDLHMRAITAMKEYNAVSFAVRELLGELQACNCN